MDIEAKQSLRRTWVAKCILLGYTLHEETNWNGEAWYARDPQGKWVRYEQPKMSGARRHQLTVGVRLSGKYDWFLAYKILRKLKVIDQHGLPPGQKGKAGSRAGKLPRRKRHADRVLSTLEVPRATIKRNSGRTK